MSAISRGGAKIDIQELKFSRKEPSGFDISYF